MEFRIKRVKEIQTILENDIQHRNKMISKYQKSKNTFTVINLIVGVATTTTGVGGIATMLTIALVPVAVALEAVSAISGVTGLIAMKLNDCVCKKIKKHQDIKLLTVNKLEAINRIFAEDENIDETEFNKISEIYENYCQSIISNNSI